MPLTLSSPPVPADWARHSPTSDPGAGAALLDAVPPTPQAIGPVARNLIAHYRAQADDLPEQTRGDIDVRWLADQLALDQSRHGCPLDVDRPLGARLQGCCRDHALFAVGVLRQHGVPARSRVGFAGYLNPDWHFDHVVAEYRDGDRWRRFDPEIDAAWGMLPDPTDLAIGSGSPFQTAAEVHALMRSGELDPATYGVAPGHPFAGTAFVVGEVFYELAHRYGDETLLWDSWGAIPPIDQPIEDETLGLVDDIAALLIAADAGDKEAETRLYTRYLADERLHPGATVVRFSPCGDPPVTVALRR